MKKIFIVLLLTLGLTSNSIAAGSSSSSSGSGDMDTKSNYDKAVKLIKAFISFTALSLSLIHI